MREVEATAKRLQNESKESDALSFEDIELMLGNRVNSAQLMDRIRQHGVSFDLTTERLTRLKAEKMDNSALDAMVKAKKK